MREIKFRCWFDNHMYKVVDIDFSYKRINLFAADTIGFDEGILMQYTGLKDKNGKEIYEGDVVIIQYNINTIVRGVIEYREYGFYVTTPSDDWEIDNYEEIEVKGNIYENPEMKSKEVLWFSDRIALENAFKKWAKEHDVKDCLNSFIVFLIVHDLIDEKKTIEYLRLVGDKK